MTIILMFLLVIFAPIIGWLIGMTIGFVMSIFWFIGTVLWMIGKCLSPPSRTKA